MEIDRIARAFFVAVAGTFSLCFAPVFAEEVVDETVKNYRIRETKDGREEFVQTFGWEGSDAALYYEVQIERRGEDDSFTEFLRETTEKDSIEVSLAAGSWRYRVVAYNLLGKAEAESDWYYFVILKAYRPSILSVSPTRIYLDKTVDGVFTISGEWLQAGAIYSLVETENEEDAYSAELLARDDDEKRVRVRFDLKNIREGTYELVVTNPGGLKARSGPIVARFRKNIDFTISVGYQMPAVLFDDTFKTYFKNTFYPLSFGIKMAFLPFKRNFGYVGIGLSGSYTRMTTDSDTYSISGNLMTAHLNFVYQFPIIKNRLTLETQVGAGLVFFNNFLFDFESGVSSDIMNSANFSIDASLALLVYFTRHWYVDIAANFVTVFMPDMSFGLIAPSIFIGRQF